MSPVAFSVSLPSRRPVPAQSPANKQETLFHAHRQTELRREPQQPKGKGARARGAGRARGGGGAMAFPLGVVPQAMKSDGKVFFRHVRRPAAPGT